PGHAEVHCNLGQALQENGDLVEALASLKRGHQLGLKQPGWGYPSAQWVQQCEQLLGLDEQLPALIRGDVQPKSTAERLALAYLCRAPRKRLYAAAVRFYAGALAADSRLADNLKAGHRYDAACAAALAAAGQGKDAGGLGDEQRAGWRR